MPSRGRGRPPHPDALTPAERRVLEELRKGGTNAEIAVRIGIGPETVKTHVSNMLAKLDLADRSQLAAWREEDAPRPRRRWLLAPFLLKPLVGAGVVAGVVVLIVVLLLLLASLPGGEDTTPVVEVSAGADYSCAFRESGTIVCWGNNEHGQLDVPAGRYRSVSAGWTHTCALTHSDQVVCWGGNDYGQTDVPLGTYRAVSAGRFYTCAIRASGELACWGSEGSWSEAPPGRFSTVVAGTRHACARRETGEAHCWGYNNKGQTDAPAGLFRSLTVGFRHTCGLNVRARRLSPGSVKCWGDVRVASAGGYLSVSTGESLTCFVGSQRRVFCWDTDLLIRLKGCEVESRADDRRRWPEYEWPDEVVCAGGDQESYYEPPHAPQGEFRSVSAGKSHACGVTASGTVECWGADGSPAVDVPPALRSPEPAE